MLNSYKELVVWQKSVTLVENIYKHTKNFPKDEVFALTNQIRRAAISIPSNIAEGRGKGSKKDFINFLYIAQGSLFELETQIYISKSLGYLKNEYHYIISNEMMEIGKMLHGMINKLAAKS